MSKWTVKKGNTSVQEILIKDKDGNNVTNLAAASWIKFQVKETKTTDAWLIEKTMADGIAVDDPSEGYLKITLEPADTNIDPQLYVMALEIKWTDTVLYEVTLVANGEETEVFEIEQDIVLVP